MKNLKTTSIEVVALIGIILILVIALSTIRIAFWIVALNTSFDPYDAVRDSPQGAYLKYEPSIEADTVKINGEKILSSADQWMIKLDDPRSGLAGVEKLFLENKGIFIIIDLNYLEKELKNTVDLEKSIPFMDIQVTVKNQRYRSSWADSSSWNCKPAFPIKAGSVPLYGKLIIYAFKQNYKHLTFRGSIRLDNSELPPEPRFICKDGKSVLNSETPIELLIEGLSFNIDSEVIYKWSGKDGHFYEL